MADPLSVLIVGGGIGGLCLAHGLVRAGIAVQVAERAHARTDWVQGYRIHIDPDGSRALHACLPAASWERFCDTVSDGAATFSFRTERLAPLLVVEVEQADDPVEQHHGISRIALREVCSTASPTSSRSAASSSATRPCPTAGSAPTSPTAPPPRRTSSSARTEPTPGCAASCSRTRAGSTPT